MDGRFASLLMTAAMFPHPWKKTDQLALAATFTHMKEAMIGFHGARLAAGLYLQEHSFRSACLGKIKVGDTKKEKLLWSKLLRARKTHWLISKLIERHIADLPTPVPTLSRKMWTTSNSDTELVVAVVIEFISTTSNTR